LRTIFFSTYTTGAISSGAVTPGGHHGSHKQQQNYASESFHPNSLLFKISPFGFGAKVFLDYAFYQYFQDNSISFLCSPPISEEKAFLPVSVHPVSS